MVNITSGIIAGLIPSVHDDPCLCGLGLDRVPESPVVEGQHMVSKAAEDLARGDS